MRVLRVVLLCRSVAVFRSAPATLVLVFVLLLRCALFRLLLSLSCSQSIRLFVYSSIRLFLYPSIRLASSPSFSVTN